MIVQWLVMTKQLWVTSNDVIFFSDEHLS